MSVRFDIPIIVLPKQTKENRVGVNRRTGKRYIGRRTPDDVKRNAKALGLIAKMNRPERPLRGPVYIELTFRFAMAKSVPAKRRFVDQQHGGHWAWKETAPDDDNLKKQMQDVLEACGFFERCDGQVAWSQTKTIWHTQGDGVEIYLAELLDKDGCEKGGR